MFKSTDDQTDTLRSKFLNRQKTDRQIDRQTDRQMKRKRSLIKQKQKQIEQKGMERKK